MTHARFYAKLHGVPWLKQLKSDCLTIAALLLAVFAFAHMIVGLWVCL